MFTQKNLMTVCCAAVLAFGLAACGSSSDDDKMATTTPATPVVPEKPGDPATPTDDEIAAAAEATTKAAKTKLDAIGDIVATVGLGGAIGTPIAEGEPGSYALSVKRDRMATTVTVTVNGATPAAAEKFTQEVDLGGGLTKHTRDGEMGEQEIVMVMTDIAAPTATAFDIEHPLNVDENGVDVDAIVALDLGGALVDTDPDQAVILAYMMASVFAAPAQGSSSVTHTFLPAAVAAGDDPAREAAMVAGYYDGAMGTYTCSGTADCTVDVNDKGELSAASDGWIFTPADDENVYVADKDFLSYGFWLKKTTKDGVVTYNEVAPFAMAHEMADSEGAVTGSASYKGDAVGVYVHNVLTPGGGMVESRTAGHFTAKASLMAYFGQPASPGDNIPPNLTNSITGIINQFMLAGDEDNDWSVALKGDIDPTNFQIMMGTANGGGTPGDLTGQFYGADGATPGAVTGEFDANFSNGSVAGGFGARKQ